MNSKQGPVAGPLPGGSQATLTAAGAAAADPWCSEQFVARVEHLSHEMLQMCEKMQAYNCMLASTAPGVSPSQLKLSTMTIFSRVQVPPNFSLNRVIEMYLNEGIERIRELLGLEVHVVFPIRKVKSTSRGKPINNFFNQLTFWYKDGTKKSVKLFINGNVHVTGCRSLREYVTLVGRICRFINAAFDQDSCRAEGVDIHMINTNFGVNIGLDLSKLKKILLDMGMCATYDREVYPGLNLKVPTATGREASVLIFISGNIIITGVKGFLEIYEAYRFIVGVITERTADVYKVRLAPAVTEKRKAACVALAHGYEQHILDSVCVW
jgi:TATA-box binding protein (TBP) (component of TFIID and TFIIIB)